MVDAVRTLPFVVTKVEQRRRKAAGGAVHHQHHPAGGGQEAGLFSRRTMRAAQDLYEGIEVGEEGPVGLITYMRTDSIQVSDAAIAAVRELHQEELRQAVPPRGAQRYSDQKNARVQALTRPSGPPTSPAPGEVQPYLEPDQFRLYQLIWQRFVASQMTPARLRRHRRGLRSGPLPVPGHGIGHGVRRLPCALHRGTGGGRGRPWTISRPFRR